MRVLVPRAFGVFEATRAACELHAARAPAHRRMNAVFACSFHAARRITRFSLAEHIKQFIPAEVLETQEEGPGDDVFANHLKVPKNAVRAGSLAAFPDELAECMNHTHNFDFARAAAALERLPLGSLITALEEYLLPAAIGSALGVLGAEELLFQVYCQNRALVAQVLPDLAMKFTLGDYEHLMRCFAFFDAASLSTTPSTTQQLDLFLVEHFGSLSFHFPQMLKSAEISTWFKLRLLLAGDEHCFEVWLKRYAAFFDASAVALLILNLGSNRLRLKAVSRWLRANPRDLATVSAGVTQPVAFRSILRPYITRASKSTATTAEKSTSPSTKSETSTSPSRPSTSATSTSPSTTVSSTSTTPSTSPSTMASLSTPSTSAPTPSTPSASSTSSSSSAAAILRCALKLNLTYDAAWACQNFAAELAGETSLLAKMLVAAAFAQKCPPNNADVAQTVSGPEETYRNFVVSNALAPLKSQPMAANTVVGLAALKLRNLCGPNTVPGNVFWQMVLSLPPESLSVHGHAQRALANLVVRRPYVEQLRYMALPAVCARGVCDVLRAHIRRIAASRKLQIVALGDFQAEEDVQLLVAGIIIASEKKSSPGETAQIVYRLFAACNLDDGPLSSFREGVGNKKKKEGEKEDDNTPAVFDMVVGEQPMAKNLILYVVARLIDHKSYVVAYQLLRAVGPQRVTRGAVDWFLRALAKEFPEESFKFVVWMTQQHQHQHQPSVPVSAHTINKMLTIMCKSQKLSESQLMNRFQNFKQLLGTELRKNVNAEAAAALVDAFLQSALDRGHGSLRRLRWALEIAEKARVSEEKFTEWRDALNAMHETGRGYWHPK